MGRLTSWPTRVEAKGVVPLFSARDEFDKAFKEFYNNFNLRPFEKESYEDLVIHPSVDIVDDKTEFKVEAEMPGVGIEDVAVSIEDGMLTIASDKEVSKKDENKNYISREISYGHYERRIALPDNVDIDKADASFKKGMLWVSIPKKSKKSRHCRDLKVKAKK